MAEWWRTRSRAVYETPTPGVELVEQVARGLRELARRIGAFRPDLADFLEFMAGWIVDRAWHRERQRQGAEGERTNAGS